MKSFSQFRVSPLELALSYGELTCVRTVLFGSEIGIIYLKIHRSRFYCLLSADNTKGEFSFENQDHSCRPENKYPRQQW